MRKHCLTPEAAFPIPEVEKAGLRGSPGSGNFSRRGLSFGGAVAREADMLWIASLHIGRSSPSFAAWRSALQLWVQRTRQRDQLARMSNGELHDIGITAADRWAEINKPWWRD